MESTLITTLGQHYHWLGSLITLVAIILVTKIAKFAAFKLSPLEQMRQINRERDKEKWAKPKYPPIVKANQRVGLAVNIIFFVLILPFMVSTDSQAITKILLDVFIILMFYDFFYYLSHRFWFHGQGKMRQIHAVHHQARTPTYLDAHYVHPIETVVGLALYIGSITVLAPLLGPYHVATIVLSFVIFTNINIINHCFVELNFFPFKTLSWITRKHHAHHVDMHKGNYATITLLYDKLFGTFE